MPESLHTPTIARALGALGRDFARFAGSRLWLLLALMIAGSIAEGFGLLMIVPLAAIALGEASQLPQWLAAPLDRVDPDRALLAAAALFLAAMALRSALLVWRDLLRGRLEANYRASLQLRAAATLAQTGWAKASRIGQAGMQSLLLNDVPRAVLRSSYSLDVAVASIFLAVQVGAGRAAVSRHWRCSQSGAGAGADPAARNDAAPGAQRRGADPRRRGQHGVGDAPPLRAQVGARPRQRRPVPRGVSLEPRPACRRIWPVRARSCAIPPAFGLRDRCCRGAAAGRRGARPGIALSGARRQPGAVRADGSTGRRAASVGAASHCNCSGFFRDRAPAGGRAAGRAERRRSRGDPLDWSRAELEDAAFLHESGRGRPPSLVISERGRWLGLRGPRRRARPRSPTLPSPAFTRCSRGRSLVDGRPLEQERIDGWRAGIAYLGQDGLVFADSVAANLIAGKGEADDAAMWTALEAVGLAARVRRSPMASAIRSARAAAPCRAASGSGC